jgi:hypothetical protein
MTKNDKFIEQLCYMRILFHSGLTLITEALKAWAQQTALQCSAIHGKDIAR